MSLRQNFFNLLAKKKDGGTKPDIPELCFEDLTNHSKINITASVFGSITREWQYSIDGVNWLDYTFGTEITGKWIFFKSKQGYGSTATSYSTYIAFSSTSERVDVTGDIRSLLYGNTGNYTSKSLTANNYAFCHLFKNMTALKSVPDDFLPFNYILSVSVYMGMFDNTGLIKAPKLPTEWTSENAASRSTYAYQEMFKDCTSLTIPPDLPSTIVPSSGYANMFLRCSSLENAPDLPATDSFSLGYGGMFNGCTSLKIAPEIHINNNRMTSRSISSIFSAMFRGCTQLIVPPPELNAIKNQGYGLFSSMFQDCTALEKSPDIKGGIWPDRYEQDAMFSGCTKLKEIRIAYTGSFGSSRGFDDWVKGVASSGTFYYDGTSTSRGVDYIPTGWTVLPYTQPTGYTVQVSISNSEKSYATGLYIYDGNDTTGTLLKSYTTVPDEVNEQFTVSSGSIFIYPTSSRDVWIEDYSASGGVSEMDVGETGWFEVNGDGSIFCNINYHY